MNRAPGESDPAESADALIRAADACSKAGRPWDAADLLERALAIDPASPGARFRLAHIRVTRPRGADDLEVGRRIVGELLAARPDSFRYHCLAALAASNLGMEEEFWRHFESAIGTTPTDEVTLICTHLLGVTARLGRGDITAFGDVVHWVDRLPSRRGRLALESPEWDGTIFRGG